MYRTKNFIAIFIALSAVVPAICRSQSIYLKEMPKDGDIPFGQVVYVDDKKCPKGEVKEVTGGNRDKSIPRKVRCVAHPDGSPRK